MRQKNLGLLFWWLCATLGMLPVRLGAPTKDSLTRVRPFPSELASTFSTKTRIPRKSVLLEQNRRRQAMFASSESQFWGSRIVACAPRHCPSYHTSCSVGMSRRTPMVMMPEGPEVRLLVDQLQPAVGQRLVDFQFCSGRYTSESLPTGFDEFRKTMTRYSDEETESASQLDVVTSWNVKGKFMWMVLDDGKVPPSDGGVDYLRSIWITLGMTGRFVNDSHLEAQQQSGKQRPRWFLEFLRLDSQTRRRIYYLDDRNFGTLRFSLSEDELNRKLASLGPDLLAPTTTGELFVHLLQQESLQKKNICKVLMDQSKCISGVGNYLLAEGLYKASIDPFCRVEELSTPQMSQLWEALQQTGQDAYRAKGMTRPRVGTYASLDNTKGEFALELQCYGQATTPRGEKVLKEPNGPHGRTIWYVEEQLFVTREERAKREEQEAEAAAAEKEQQADKKPSTKSPSKRDLAIAAMRAMRKEENGGASRFSTSTEEQREEWALQLANAITENSWKEALGDFLQSSEWERIATFLHEEMEARGHVIYPPVPDKVFTALNLCPLHSVKVVILGQDPYHGEGQAHGLSFSVPRNVQKVPPSLQNILKELVEDVGIEPPTHGCLERWAREEGVLLLNTVWTVRAQDANSHAQVAQWEAFTNRILQTISNQCDFVVFLVWGKSAAERTIPHVDSKKHVLLESSHPSPLSASRTSTPFLTSRCFSRTNQALRKVGLDAVDWNL